jgi:hypothetical protein
VSFSLSEPKFTADVNQRLHRGRARQIVKHQVIHASVKELEVGVGYKQKAKPSGEKVIYEYDRFERARYCVMTLVQSDELGRPYIQTPPEARYPDRYFRAMVDKSECTVCTFLNLLLLN